MNIEDQADQVNMASDEAAAAAAANSTSSMEWFNWIVVVDQTIRQLFDQILGTLAFIVGIMLQIELSKGEHYFGIVIFIFALAVVASEMAEFLRTLAVKSGLRRPWPIQYVIKAVYTLVLFLCGVFARSIADLFTNSPRAAPFSVGDLFKPLIFILLILAYFFQQQMRQAPSAYIRQILQKARVEAQRKSGRSAAFAPPGLGLNKDKDKTKAASNKAT
jgi:hypothetical protein